MRRTISQLTGLAAIAALICAGCGGNEDKNGDASGLLSWANGYTLKVSVESPNSGEVEYTPKKSYYAGDDVITAVAKPKSGYRLKEWRGASNAMGVDTVKFTLDRNQTLTAVFESAQLRNIRFNLNDAPAAAITTIEAYPGDYITLPGLGGEDDPFIFRYWATNTGERYEAGSPYLVPSSGATLSAQWEYLYKVTFDRNGGTGTAPTALKQASDSTITLPGQGDLKKNGYKFNGWSEAPDGTEIPPYEEGYPYPIKADTTLYAQWVDTSFDVGEMIEDDIMVQVEGGTVTIGETGETVVLDDFLIGKYEVTQKLWVSVMGTNPSQFKGDDLPVHNVSWEEIQDFIAALNAKTGENYRLPTEAEWEFAAKGGNESGGYIYSGSANAGNNSSTGVAVYKYASNPPKQPAKTGSKGENELGLYDMSGNVWEWVAGACWGCDPDYEDYVGTVRGGAWGWDAVHCTVTRRLYRGVGYRDNDVGFRLARDP